MSDIDEVVDTLETMAEWFHLDGCEKEVRMLIDDWRKLVSEKKLNDTNLGTGQAVHNG